MKVVEYICRILQSFDVTHVFCVGGSAVLPLQRELSRHLNVVETTSESGAVHMADGYARVSGGLGVALTTAGPGAINTCTAVATAQLDFVPLLVITGQTNTDSDGLGAFQESTPSFVDTVAILEKLTKFSVSASNVSDVPKLMRTAIELALAPPMGPAHVALPVDVSTAELCGNNSGISNRSNLVQLNSREYSPSQKQLQQVMNLAESSQRNIVVSGSGVLRSGATKNLQQLATVLNAEVYVTPKAVSSISHLSPNYCGVIGYPGNPESLDKIVSSESSKTNLFVIGSSLGEFATRSWDSRIWKNKRVVVIDACRRGERLFETSVWLKGDIRISLETLAKILPIAQEESLIPVHLARSKSKLGDGFVLDIVSCISEYLGLQTHLFIDIGNAMLWAIPNLIVGTPGTVHINLGFGGMGFACAAITGACCHGTRAIALTGDGAFMMQAFETNTAKRYGLNPIWIVLNDSGFGMLRQVESHLYGDAISSKRFEERISFYKFAESVGIQGFEIRDFQEFQKALAAALDSPKPCIIDVMIAPTEIPNEIVQRASTIL